MCYGERNWPDGLEQHFQRLLKDWREEQQKKHGERVEARAREYNTSLRTYDGKVE